MPRGRVYAYRHFPVESTTNASYFILISSNDKLIKTMEQFIILKLIKWKGEGNAREITKRAALH
jgi:hypothetical protein